MRTRRGKFFQALALVACTVATASAVVPEAEAGRIQRNTCFSYNTAGARGRQMGVRNAEALFTRVWQRLGRSCDQLDNLARVISEVPLAAGRSEMGACFAQGYVETLFSELDAAYLRCGDRCYSAGAEIGQISAMGYCAASMALGGLDDPGFIAQPALPFCGANIVFGCKTEYVATATFDIQGCRAYTEGYFSQTFDNVVRQDCFVPADVPVRDGHYFGAADDFSSMYAM